MDEFIEQFAEAIGEMELESIRSDTAFRKLTKWDSMAALIFLSMADEEYGVQVSSVDLEKCNSVEDLFNLVNGRK